MKLLIIGPDMRERSKVKNFTGVYAFYLCRELRLRGIDMEFWHYKPAEATSFYREKPATDCDHALMLGLRHFTQLPPGIAPIIKTKVKGMVTQLHDGLVHEWHAPAMEGVDCTFMFRDDASRTKGWSRYADSNCYIGWAADPDLFFPQQLTGEMRILIDHPYYKGGTPDLTKQVTQEVMKFAYGRRWRERFRTIKVRRLVNGGVEDVTLDNISTPIFTREHVSIELIAPEYRRTYVYMVTHKESVGMTCLETAMCGALVVAPKGLIYEDRLATIRHVAYEDHVPWGEVLKSCDYRASALMAKQQTWPKVVDRMLAWFKDHS